ncbi:hypothetical protein EG328_000497 [Venturia inaequalis]|uniref:Uncharacterized protein n=1 Tax=Venturia inaequalis TaxID=5025 RepID=A0A8H3U547_VENIN|nr:hypothetical protein EG328_000497 [Venturia inaequalis]RDI79051.1 hypothetical protein Vi05172_g10830 [Venturia inaequalis]
MSTPLLVRSTSSPSKATVSSPDTFQLQLKPASPHPDPISIPTEADPAAIDPQSALSLAEDLDLDQTQEETVGGRFFNNPYGTVLTTIAELGSTSTLLADPNEPQRPNRARIEQDAAALKEFRKIVDGRTSESSSEEIAAAGGNVGLGRQSLEKKMLAEERLSEERLAEKKLATESGVLEHTGTCLSDHGSALPGSTRKGPSDDHRANLGQASTKIRSECLSPKHLFHIFPDYIQLGSTSQLETPHHVQTNSTETQPRSNSVVTIYEGCQRLGISEASEDTVGTRYLPVGHVSHPSSSQEQRRSAASSSTSAQAPRRSVDEWAYGKYTYSAGRQQHHDGSASQDSYQIESNDKIGNYADTGKVNFSSSSANNGSRSPLRSTTHSPPSQAHASQQNRRRSSAPSSLENRGISQMGTPSTHTFRSAALESLLPIAAAEGIIIPYTLTPHHATQARTPSNPTTRLETSHSEVSVLFHRGNVCRHRAAAYLDKGIEPRDTLLQIPEQARFDGAVEIRERRDWCWRCRVERRMDRVAGAAMPKSCCFSGADKAGEAERARLVDV